MEEAVEEPVQVEHDSPVVEAAEEPPVSMAVEPDPMSEETAAEPAEEVAEPVVEPAAVQETETLTESEPEETVAEEPLYEETETEEPAQTVPAVEEVTAEPGETAVEAKVTVVKYAYSNPVEGDDVTFRAQVENLTGAYTVTWQEMDQTVPQEMRKWEKKAEGMEYVVPFGPEMKTTAYQLVITAEGAEPAAYPFDPDKVKQVTLTKDTVPAQEEEAAEETAEPAEAAEVPEDSASVEAALPAETAAAAEVQMETAENAAVQTETADNTAENTQTAVQPVTSEQNVQKTKTETETVKEEAEEPVPELPQETEDMASMEIVFFIPSAPAAETQEQEAAEVPEETIPEALGNVETAEAAAEPEAVEITETAEETAVVQTVETTEETEAAQTDETAAEPEATETAGVTAEPETVETTDESEAAEAAETAEEPEQAEDAGAMENAFTAEETEEAYAEEAPEDAYVAEETEAFEEEVADGAAVLPAEDEEGTEEVQAASLETEDDAVLDDPEAVDEADIALFEEVEADSGEPAADPYGQTVEADAADGTVPGEESEDYVLDEAAVLANVRVSVMSGSPNVLRPGDTISLVGTTEGLDSDTLTYQWECDKGSGFEPIEDANEDVYSFEVSAESMTWNWRLVVYAMEKEPEG